MYLFVVSFIQWCKLYLHFLYTKDFNRLKRNMNDGTIVFLTSLVIPLKSDCYLPKFFFICFNNSPSNIMKNAFYFISKALFVLKICKILSWVFKHVEKTAWLEKSGSFRNLWRHSLVNKEWQYTNCSISHELKATRK